MVEALAKTTSDVIPLAVDALCILIIDSEDEKSN